MQGKGLKGCTQSGSIRSAMTAGQAAKAAQALALRAEVYSKLGSLSFFFFFFGGGGGGV